MRKELPQGLSSRIGSLAFSKLWAKAVLKSALRGNCYAEQGRSFRWIYNASLGNWASRTKSVCVGGWMAVCVYWGDFNKRSLTTKTTAVYYQKAKSLRNKHNRRRLFLLDFFSPTSSLLSSCLLCPLEGRRSHEFQTPHPLKEK